jgi:hypothetical protein
MNEENDDSSLEALSKTHGGAYGQLKNIAAMEEITPCRAHVA